MLKISNKGKTGTIDLYDAIGIWGITAKDFQNELKALGSDVKYIDLNINSPGGDVFDGMAIYSAIKRLPATVSAYVDGLSASIASVIMMAADTVSAPSNATVMIHPAWGFTQGDADEHRKTAEVLEKTDGQILDIYTAKAGDERRDELAAAVKAETWLTGDEAHDMGLVDTVTDQMQIAACISSDFLQRVRKETGLYQNVPENLIYDDPGAHHMDNYKAELTRRANVLIRTR